MYVTVEGVVYLVEEGVDLVVYTVCVVTGGR